MEIVFRSLEQGKQLFGVLRQGRELFVGTRAECGRYLDLHRAKLAEQREAERRPLRHAPFQVRSYRVAAPRAG